MHRIPLETKCAHKIPDVFKEKLHLKFPNWLFFSILLQIHQYFSLFSSLPQIVCLAFLSFQYPLLLFKGFTVTEQNKGSEVTFNQPVCCTVYTVATSRSTSEICLSSNEKKPKHLKKPFLHHCKSCLLFRAPLVLTPSGLKEKRGVQLRMPVA